jgi:hypothetical protein
MKAPATPLEWAFRYAGHFGLPVFPVIVTASGHKCPAIPKREGGSGHKDATTDPGRIEWWWGGRYRDALIGMPTGLASHVVILDVDVKDDGRNGFDTLADLGKPLLPDTVMTHTRSGGVHIWFAYDGNPEIRNSAGASGLGRALDIRGEGGWVVLPGGNSGYTWDPHHDLENTELRPVPAWLGHKTKQPRTSTSTHDGKRFDPQRSLDEACNNIRRAGDADKYHTIRREPFIVACLVRDRLLDKNVARHALDAALADLEKRASNPRHMWNMAAGAWDEGLASGRRAAR